jgi:putative Mg2+ transporter-C (MgtC) family protein
MDLILRELAAGLPDLEQAARAVIRLTMAALLGAIIGIQRERADKPAGLRTHMLVALGAALFVIAPLELGMSNEDLSRVIQGIVAGIGFLGAGAILKLAAEREITGLTTAAGIWMTAAVGLAAGLGRWGTATIGVVLSLVILTMIGKLEARYEARIKAKAEILER